MNASRCAAARDPALVSAYLATSYRVDAPGGRIVLRIGQRSRPLERVLRRSRAQCWAYVTACNPASRSLSGWRNAARARRLARLAAAWGLRTLPGEGVGEDPAWGAEASLLVLGVAPARAIRLARQFGQYAIVVGRRGAAPRLEWCRA